MRQRGNQMHTDRSLVAKSIDSARDNLQPPKIAMQDLSMSKKGSFSPSPMLGATKKGGSQLGQTKRRRDLEQTKNLHANFKNLNPHYDELRFQRARDLADHWLERIG